MNHVPPRHLRQHKPRVLSWQFLLYLDTYETVTTSFCPFARHSPVALVFRHCDSLVFLRLTLEHGFHGGHQGGRIQSGIKPVHGPMQMGAGCTAGSANPGNQVALFYLCALLNQYFAEVNKGGGYTISMVQDQGSTGKEHIRVHQGHHSSRRSNDRSSRGCCHIHAVMGRARLAVEDPLAAKNTTDASGGRPDKILQEIQALKILGPGLTGQGTLLTDALQLLWGRSHMLLGHPVDPLNGIIPLADFDLLGVQLAVRCLYPQGLGQFAIAPDAEYKVSAGRDPYSCIIEPHRA